MAALDPQALKALETLAFDTARNDLRYIVATRREQVALMQRRCNDVDQAEQARARQQQARDERVDEAEEAAARREAADAGVEQQGHALLDAWQSHFDGLQQLRIDADPSPLDALAAWVPGSATSRSQSMPK